MKDFFDNLRFDHPAIFKWLMASFFATVVCVIFFSLPPSPLLRAMGVTSVQKKMSSLYYAVFWQVRAATNDAPVEGTLKTTFGSLAGLDPSGMLVVSMPEGNHFVQSRVWIADIKITDLYGTAALIGGLRTEDAKFDVYPGNQVVVWIRDVPFNVKVIEAGFGSPDPNPPTNIVDKAFAAYYWRIFNGN